jgi:hypothetical protein
MAKKSSVVRPSAFWFLLLDGGLVALGALVFSQKSYDAASDASSGKLPERSALRGLLFGAAATHVVEALVAGRMATRRGLSPRGWRLQTFVVGFPSLLVLRRTPKS